MNCILEGCKSCISSFFWLPFLAAREKKKEHKTPLKVCLLQWIIFAASRRLWCGGQSCILWGFYSETFERMTELCPGRGEYRWLFANELEGQIRQQFDRGILFCQAELLLLWQMCCGHAACMWQLSELPRQWTVLTVHQPSECKYLRGSVGE